MSKGELTKQRIIEEAAPIFNQRGFAGSSMQDIMAATGLEKGGLYRHFASKDELAVAAFDYAFAQVKAARWCDDSKPQSAVAKLLQRVRQFVRVPSPVKGGCPLMNTAIDADDTHVELRRLARAAIHSWKEQLSQIVQEGIRVGEIRKDAEPGRIANVIIATLEGALMISRLEGNKTAMLDAEATLEALIEGLASGRVSHRAAPPKLPRSVQSERFK